MTDQTLEGKVALITGASSGLGRAFALALARAGVKVFLVARREEMLRGVVEEIASAGGEAAYHVADVRVTPALYDLVDVLLARFKRLDILINNAGVGYRAPLIELKRTEILEMLETDLHAAIFLCQAALNALLKSAPSDIVNVSSISGLEGFPEATVYGAAKSGIVGFTRALAQELKPANVRATAICAGSIDTAFFERFRPSVEPARRLTVDDAVRALIYVLTSPPNVLHGEIVIRPRVVGSGLHEPPR
ncbi:MAG TPA: SDR family oxidoreductase [Thermoanaerobaculia bacterium]|jgi:NAD(P)-dependent dehydrogenase (short-subunit alcohol dehydrogenase family)|nr:SDR family oxidoreductase [Thermoanaerobaculia bacterium]